MTYKNIDWFNTKENQDLTNGKIEIFPSKESSSFDKILLNAVETENKFLREQLDKAALKLLKLEREDNRKKWLLNRILDSLPIKRDWLDPDYEKEMKFYVNEQ